MTQIVLPAEERLSRLRERTAEARQQVWRDILGGIRPRPIGGGAPTLPTTLAALRAAVTANTFTSAQTIIGLDNRGPFSVDWFSVNGAQWEMEAMGTIGTTGTPTIAFRSAFGTALASITTSLATSATITTASGLANVDWYCYVMGRTVSAAGASSTMLVSGFLQAQLAAAAANNIINYIKNATPPSAVTTDLSSTVYLDLQATWGTSSASNTITTNHYRLTSIQL